MVSYDTVEVASKKADWINQQGLGGGMYWSVMTHSGDSPFELLVDMTGNYPGITHLATLNR